MAIGQSAVKSPVQSRDCYPLGRARDWVTGGKSPALLVAFGRILGKTAPSPVLHLLKRG